jgi:hypothetical protein
MQCNPGEGDSPRVALADRAPHPNPLPAKGGEREKWCYLYQLELITL